MNKVNQQFKDLRDGLVRMEVKQTVAMNQLKETMAAVNESLQRLSSKIDVIGSEIGQMKQPQPPDPPLTINTPQMIACCDRIIDGQGCYKSPKIVSIAVNDSSEIETLRGSKFVEALQSEFEDDSDDKSFQFEDSHSGSAAVADNSNEPITNSVVDIDDLDKQLPTNSVSDTVTSVNDGKSLKDSGNIRSSASVVSVRFVLVRDYVVPYNTYSIVSALDNFVAKVDVPIAWSLDVLNGIVTSSLIKRATISLVCGESVYAGWSWTPVAQSLIIHCSRVMGVSNDFSDKNTTSNGTHSLANPRMRAICWMDSHFAKDQVYNGYVLDHESDVPTIKKEWLLLFYDRPYVQLNQFSNIFAFKGGTFQVPLLSYLDSCCLGSSGKLSPDKVLASTVRSVLLMPSYHIFSRRAMVASPYAVGHFVYAEVIIGSDVMPFPIVQILRLLFYDPWGNNDYMRLSKYAYVVVLVWDEYEML